MSSADHHLSPVSGTPKASRISAVLAEYAQMPDVHVKHLTFADLTTLRVGGRPAAVVECSTVAALVAVVRGLDNADIPLLVVGGGSNLVVGDDSVNSDNLAELVVVRPVAAAGPEIVDHSAAEAISSDAPVPETTIVRAFAGVVWDDLVSWSVHREIVTSHGTRYGLGGLECLSGIPGTVGAAPVQNIGAYGAEVSASLYRVQLFDRSLGELLWVEPESLDLSYRYSNLKFSTRAVVTAVEFRLATDGLSVPLRFGELSRRLGVTAEESAPQRPVAEVRDAVLALRRGKGMVLDAADHDTWSAGSFFTNPVVYGIAARDTVMAKARGHCGADVAEALPCYSVPNPDAEDSRNAYKFSAAWLIDHAGFPKGWRLSAEDGGTGRASLSSKHTLALTNRGAASAADIVDLATAVRDGVRETFGVTLVPEPVWVGVILPE